MKKFVILLIIMVLFFFISRIFIVNKSNSYEKELIKEVNNNYKLKEKIKYINKYNNYYILKTNSHLIVLDRKYQEIVKDNINKLFKISSYDDIIYKNNKIVYMKVKVSNKEYQYIYYDAYTGEELDTTSLGGN